MVNEVSQSRSVRRSGGGLSVGAYIRPARAYLGGGNDITEFVHVFSDDGTSGRFIDHSDDAKSRSGSTFSLFQGTGSEET